MIENNQKKSKKPALSKSKGGARPGAGRKEGSLTKRTREIAEVAAAQGITPLEVMMSTMIALYKRRVITVVIIMTMVIRLTSMMMVIPP